MTHDERIEAMARAIARGFAEATSNEDGDGETLDEYVDKYWPEFVGDARAAWAAADVEGMVREAALLSLQKALRHTPFGHDAHKPWADDIVARVMGGLAE